MMGMTTLSGCVFVRCRLIAEKKPRMAADQKEETFFGVSGRRKGRSLQETTRKYANDSRPDNPESKNNRTADSFPSVGIKDRLGVCGCGPHKVQRFSSDKYIPKDAKRCDAMQCP